MDGRSAIGADAVVALSRAIDAAMDRGDIDEATRSLASPQGAEGQACLRVMTGAFPPAGCLTL
jgi:hypothetical protein